MTESEITKTAQQIEALGNEFNENRRIIDEKKLRNSEISELLNSLSNKIKSLVSPFTYGHEPKKIDEVKVKVKRTANIVGVKNNLGPAIYANKSSALRKKVLEYALNLPYVDRPNTARFLINSGYQIKSAEIVRRMLFKYLKERGWEENANGQLIKPKEFKLDLNTATKEEKEIFLNHATQ